MNGDALLNAGVILIGVYVAVHAIPSFAKALLDSRRIWAGQRALHAWSGIIPPALQLALGLFLSLRPSKVIDLITDRKDPMEPTDAGDSYPAAGR